MTSVLHAAENWFNAFAGEMSGPLSEGSAQCEVWEDAPTLVIERDTFANFFHNSEVCSAVSVLTLPTQSHLKSRSEWKQT